MVDCHNLDGKDKRDSVGKTKKGTGTKWMMVVSGEGVSVAFHLDPASPTEVTLLE